jgi:hypothetical protein
MADLSLGIEEQARYISFLVGHWHDFGYEVPPAPGCKTIPPLGERSPGAVLAAHEAIGEIDVLARRLSALRAQLEGELRQDGEARAGKPGRGRRVAVTDPSWFECCCGTAHFLGWVAASLIAGTGPLVPVAVEGSGAWLVPRVFIAAHGLKAGEVPALAERYEWGKVAGND